MIFPKKTYLTCWGPVRGCCGHVHRTVDGSQSCLRSDRRGCRKQGGYSDRVPRVVDGRADLDGYDVTKGPGRALGSWN